MPLASHPVDSDLLSRARPIIPQEKPFVDMIEQDSYHARISPDVEGILQTSLGPSSQSPISVLLYRASVAF